MNADVSHSLVEQSAPSAAELEMPAEQLWLPAELLWLPVWPLPPPWHAADCLPLLPVTTCTYATYAYAIYLCMNVHVYLCNST